MKFYTLTVAILIVSVFALTAAEIVCPTEQEDESIVIQYPSPTSCSVFYKCNRGIAYMNKCPDGLHYNELIQACDFPSRAHCHLADII
ncbi:peritrophin-1-like [Teleopsis dalmanni]|uniref:peritrophin-1-like n=1 Tax=Teleopsis dalmanni TaxID=139649 RepID=UPI000D32C38B|nr:peritrophin-1-like [Teleopsis dalmanni]